jgi:hypothetical protein
VTSRERLIQTLDPRSWVGKERDGEVQCDEPAVEVLLNPVVEVRAPQWMLEFVTVQIGEPGRGARKIDKLTACEEMLTLVYRDAAAMPSQPL